MNVMIMEQKLENFTLELLDLSSATTSGPFPLISHPPLRCRPWKRYLVSYIPYNYVKNRLQFIDQIIVVFLKLNYFQVALIKTIHINYCKILYLSFLQLFLLMNIIFILTTRIYSGPFKVVYLTNWYSTFCLNFHLTGIHFRGELQHIGHGGEQKVKCEPIKTYIKLLEEMFHFTRVSNHSHKKWKKFISIQ